MSDFKVSIITVVLNRKEHLKKTIESIASQSYKDIEYIVVDGISTDGTLDVVNQHSDIISKWISEKDKGIYDAMNKGLKMATGDYVWFLNAGDRIYSPNTLQELANLNIKPDAFYGDVLYIDEEGNDLGTRQLKKPPEEFSWKSMVEGMVVCHQSFIVRRDKTQPYNTAYKYCADIDWMISALKNSKEVYNTRKILSKFLVGGFSKHNIIKSNKERFGILSKHYGLVRTAGNHVLMALKFLKYYLTTKEKHY